MISYWNSILNFLKSFGYLPNIFQSVWINLCQFFQKNPFGAGDDTNPFGAEPDTGLEHYDPFPADNGETTPQQHQIDFGMYWFL